MTISSSTQIICTTATEACNTRPDLVCKPHESWGHCTPWCPHERGLDVIVSPEAPSPSRQLAKSPASWLTTSSHGQIPSAIPAPPPSRDGYTFKIPQRATSLQIAQDAMCCRTAGRPNTALELHAYRYTSGRQEARQHETQRSATRRIEEQRPNDKDPLRGEQHTIPDRIVYKNNGHLTRR